MQNNRPASTPPPSPATLQGHISWLHERLEPTTLPSTIPPRGNPVMQDEHSTSYLPQTYVPSLALRENPEPRIQAAACLWMACYCRSSGIYCTPEHNLFNMLHQCNPGTIDQLDSSWRPDSEECSNGGPTIEVEIPRGARDAIDSLTTNQISQLAQIGDYFRLNVQHGEFELTPLESLEALQQLFHCLAQESQNWEALCGDAKMMINSGLDVL